MLFSLLKKVLPTGLKISLKNQLQSYLEHDRPKAYQCSVCKQKLAKFNMLPMPILANLEKHQFIHGFCSETANILQYSCPNCGASDRDRLYAAYIEKAWGRWQGRVVNILDIAPAKGLSQLLRRMPGAHYRSADLYMEGVDDKVDLMDMAIYEDEQFDMFVCSHVLEHVANDRKAMRELYRVLKKGGWGIAMVPIFLDIPTGVDENPAIASPEDRWKHYGQDDHVRAYSKQGFVDRLTEAGFTVKQYGIDFFGEAYFKTCGISQRSVLYIVEK